MAGASPAVLAAATAEDIHTLEATLGEQKDRAAQLDQQDKSNRAELEALRGRLVTAATALEQQQQEQDDLDARLAALEKQRDDQAALLKDRKRTLNRLMIAMLRLSREPPMLDMLFGDDLGDAQHRAMIVRFLAPRIKNEADHIAGQIAALDSVRDQAAAQKQRVLAARAELEAQKNTLDAMIRTRQTLAEQTASEREKLAQRMDALAAEAKTLRQLMDKVEREAKKPHAHKKGERQHATPDLALRYPVAGRIARAYGERDADGIASQGMTFTAAPGATVVAPDDGRVAFAGPFRGYGLIVILDHGQGTHSFLSGFGRLNVDVGQYVARGEPLGAMPDAQGGERPDLYLEWRENGAPTQPTLAR